MNARRIQLTKGGEVRTVLYSTQTDRKKNYRQTKLPEEKTLSDLPTTVDRQAGLPGKGTTRRRI